MQSYSGSTRYARSNDSKIHIAALLSSGSLLLPHLGL